MLITNLDKKITVIFRLYELPQNKDKDDQIYLLVVQAVIDEMFKFIAEELGEIKVKVIEKAVLDSFDNKKINQEELLLMTYSVIIKTLVTESKSNHKDLHLYLDKRLDYFLINLRMSYNNNK